MAPTSVNQQEKTTIRAILCGTKIECEVSFNTIGSNPETVEGEVLSGLGVDKNYTTLSHSDDEFCLVQRPMDDYWGHRAERDSWFRFEDGLVLKVHLHRVAKRKFSQIQRQEVGQGASSAVETGNGPGGAEGDGQDGGQGGAGPEAEVGRSTKSALPSAKSSAGTKQVMVHLHNLGAAKMSGPSRAFARTASITEVQSWVEDAVVGVAKEDPGAHKKLRDADGITVNITVQRDGARPAIMLDDEHFGSRYTTLLDFFDGAATTDDVLDLELDVVAIDRTDTTTRPHSSLELDIESLVQRKSHADEDKYIASEFPVLAEVDREQQKIVNLWATNCWVSADSCIGGFGFQKKKVAMTTANLKDIKRVGGYKGTRSQKELGERFSARIGTNPEVSSFPPITFNIMQPRGLRQASGQAEAAKGVVAVRFVNHLVGPEAEKLKFNDNFQITFEKMGKTSAAAIEAIWEALVKAPGAKALAKPSLKDSWRLDLWLMPQITAPQKLYRYATPRTMGQQLINFLKPDFSSDDHAELCMEAHLWPIEAEEFLEEEMGKIEQPAEDSASRKKHEEEDRGGRGEGGPPTSKPKSRPRTAAESGAATKPSARERRSKAKLPAVLADEDEV